MEENKEEECEFLQAECHFYASEDEFHLQIHPRQWSLIQDSPTRHQISDARSHRKQQRRHPRERLHSTNSWS
jgi:hypothetical protein